MSLLYVELHSVSLYVSCTTHLLFEKQISVRQMQFSLRSDQAGHTMGSKHGFHLVRQLYAVKKSQHKKNEV